ncbi:hypothetical protein SADUNF_Sadunf03G0132800 [Salix dunnii]|uniref:Uncharacterized protein n=1 Tax=Salix dunnii TaxID=1413687 RepID=A0A835TE10_9ROSI|nr:hypothetical protein SADUNF_Sadunf03G0132800 [Salix dunnii]
MNVTMSRSLDLNVIYQSLGMYVFCHLITQVFLFHQAIKMRSQSLFLSGVLLIFAYSASPLRAANGDGVTEECSGDFQKVMGCLSYATGKANTPTKDCCSSVQDIKESDPKCLCFIMQKTHNGSAQIKALGIQEAKLLQLPTACQLQNASLSFCPKLLGISPGSPDAAIFTNASTTVTPATSASTGTSQPEKAGCGIQQRPHLAVLFMIVAAIFVFASPAGSASMFQGFNPILFASFCNLVSCSQVNICLSPSSNVLISGCLFLLLTVLLCHLNVRMTWHPVHLGEIKQSLSTSPIRKNPKDPITTPCLRNSSAAKRARTDGSRREDDWTCPSCGNVNFSFRTTCNMRNCTQPRPADHNSKSAAKPLQAPQGYSSAPYMGSGAPSSMYMGMPPYGSSLFNGSGIPPYDVPFTGGSAYHYNYGSRLSGGSPYRPLHMSGPPPYSGGSMMGNGGMYAMPPLMDRYGLGMPMGPAAMGPRPGFFPDDKLQKGSDATRDNDWTCPKCGNINFSFRTFCNMRKCNTPKPGSQAAKVDKNSKQKMPEGSWKCEKCNNINYPFRTKCNRQNCGAEKPSELKKSPSPEPDEAEQVCHVIHLDLSSRTCLGVEKVQSCRPALLNMVSESQSCRPHVAALNLVEIQQFGYVRHLYFGIIHLFQWDDMNLEYCSLHISFSFDEIVSTPLKLGGNLIRMVGILECGLPAGLFPKLPWFLDHPLPLFDDDFEVRPEKKGYSTLLLRDIGIQPVVVGSQTPHHRSRPP